MKNTGREATVVRGFQLANIDAGLLADPKLLRLVTVIPDEGERACTILVYLQTVLRSWQEGRRLSAEEAEGLWPVTAERIQALETVRLIDDEHHVLESAWERFYFPAFERAEQRRRAGRKGGRASVNSRKQRSSTASASVRRGSSGGRAPLNLTPADPPSPEGEAGRGQAGQRVGSAPARPPVRMDRLEDADIDALESMRRELPLADGRRRRVETEIDARRAAEPRRTPTSGPRPRPRSRGWVRRGWPEPGGSEGPTLLEPDLVHPVEQLPIDAAVGGLRQAPRPPSRAHPVSK